MAWKLNPPDVANREDPPLSVLPAEPSDVPQAVYSIWGLFELLLKAPKNIDPFLRLPELQPRFVVSFALMTLVGLSAHALVLWGILVAQPGAIPTWLRETPPSLLTLLVAFMAAFPLGIFLATLLLLPAYWYLGRLARLRMSVLEVLSHSLKGKATSSILLLGLLPIYGVLVGCVILAQLGDAPVQLLLYVGFVLPFLCGLRGAGAIAEGFSTVAETTAGLSRANRESLPSSLIVAWALLFIAVTPVVMVKAFQLVMEAMP
jgi:uncharacterized membrane protein